MPSFPKSVLVLVVLAFGAGTAPAAVVQSRPDGFLIEIDADLAAPPVKAYAALAEVGRWWSPAHTWSGDARNLTLSLDAGACFCERWEDGSVEHARVLFAKRDELLRLGGALGPLQSMAVTGVVSFAFEPKGKGTTLHVSHRVSGDPAHSLDQIAPFADQMLIETIGRFVRYVATGKPE